MASDSSRHGNGPRGAGAVRAGGNGIRVIPRGRFGPGARGQGHEAAVRVAGPAGHKAQERGARRIPLGPGVSGTMGYRVPPSKYGSRASFAPSPNGDRNRRHDCRASSCLDSSDDDQTIPRTPPRSRARCSPCQANAATSRRSRAIIMRASLAHAACSFFWSGSSGQRGIPSRSGPCG